MLKRLARNRLVSLRLTWLLTLFLLSLIAGVDTPIGRLLLAAHFGAFLLWQPVVPGSERLTAGSAAGLIGMLLAFQWWQSWVLVALWCGLLAALTAAQVRSRQPLLARLPELLGFAWLAVTLLVWLVPAGLPMTAEEQSLLVQLPWASGLVLLPLIAALEWKRRPRVMPDLALAAVVLLALAAIALGAISLMFLLRLDYASALLRAGAAVAATLMLLGWLWNPRIGFAGLALLLSRRALRTGMPLEHWLGELARDAGPRETPEQLLARGAASLAQFPGVRGVAWAWPEAKVSGAIGIIEAATPTFEHRALRIRIDAGSGNTALLWRHDLLARVLAEFVQSRRQARALAEFDYLRAIHETGVRLTHDIKNLLQSLETLVWALEQAGPGQTVAASALLAQQLPLISGRLRLVLKRLGAPQSAQADRAGLSEWWTDVVARYAGQAIGFERKGRQEADVRIPVDLFDRFVDNCLMNASAKRTKTPALSVQVVLNTEAALVLAVEDDGPAIPDALAKRLLREPIASAGGFGVGLLQLAREAADAGWDFRLASNQAGCVRFELVATSG